MKKTLYPLAMIASTFLLVQCAGNQTKDLADAKKQLYDSARKVILDSLANKNSLDQESLVHNPPDDGHIHDGGTGLTGKFSTNTFVSGTMDVVTDSAHTIVTNTYPFIVQKGLINPGDDYMSDKVKHAHLIYELVPITLKNPAGTNPPTLTVDVAIVKRVKPK